MISFGKTKIMKQKQQQKEIRIAFSVFFSLFILFSIDIFAAIFAFPLGYVFCDAIFAFNQK
jgi:hypothetical protein